MNPSPIPSVLTLYLRLVPIISFAGFLLPSKRCRNRCVFSIPVIIWLMIFQRLHDKGTLAEAVQQVVRGLPSALNPQSCKRQRERNVSSNTGGYNQARQKVPWEVVRTVSDEIFEQLMAPQPDQRIFILDGTTLTMPCTPSLLETYPPSRNQNGESHWPILRLLAAHDLDSGIALRPEWGSCNGAKAASEQRLTEALIPRLPARAALLGDRNFGVFSVAWAAQQSDHPVLLRLTVARAKAAFGSSFNNRTDLNVGWKPSKSDRKSHPDLPCDASVRGRLIVRKVYPSDGSGPLTLYLFTTLDLPAREIVRIYAKRWNIETDLRTIKKTIRLEMLDCQTPDMIAKELTLAITAYNLVRAVINESAQRTGMNPRQYSFSRVQNLINAWLPYLSSITSEAEHQAEYERMIRSAGQCKLYKRKKPTSYPRAVWHRRRTFPPQKSDPTRSPRKEKNS